MVGVTKVTPQGKPIIKNIYLSFFYGAKIGIIGLNGSGKSTMCKLIYDLLKNSKKKVYIGGNYGTPVLNLPYKEKTFTIYQTMRSNS